MRRLVLPVLVGVLLLPIAGCGGPSSITSAGRPSGTSASPLPTPTAPPIGDPCLVGRWVVQDEHYAYSFRGREVPVDGGGGLVITFSADGTETDDWDSSQPYSGSLDGDSFRVVSHGTTEIHGVRADGETLTEPPGDLSNYRVSIEYQGQTIPVSSPQPTSASRSPYSCKTTSLTITYQPDHLQTLKRS